MVLYSTKMAELGAPKTLRDSLQYSIIEARGRHEMLKVRPYDLE